MIFTSPRQLKDKIRNAEQKYNLPANTLLNYYMMERFLCRLSNSEYSDNFIIKGGFLISSLIGIDMRSTMDIDTTIKGIPVNEESIRKIIEGVIKIELEDNITWAIEKIRSIHEAGEYDDFRITLIATFFNMQTPIKIDITTGDRIIPKEVDYNYQLLFTDKSIDIKAYPLTTILAEKIETILSRNVLNTRARDYYDIYILTKLNPQLDYEGLRKSLTIKAEERNSLEYIQNSQKYLKEIKASKELKDVWDNYSRKNQYSKEIDWNDILSTINEVLTKLSL
ncbi:MULTISPECIES: nucleotidyl transferase AbiEii/AbiGii toxin family protein [Anaerococcus]|uniref:Abortive phage infection protein n=1 Tax=Anaerococcus octavius TaxID=54007 RepID=A0A2I1M6M4_9FIRM|nr:MULTISPECIES: nucleotidyl transferase AbiEii/AbiGii toxin family protein [Anaerococcus]MBS6106064.1 nucleotidyl transferase AbiEii/AbiGii toxin family protein [Anaerococcus sp.]PKZ15739.1 abortive phage infection protein [Anaerococcus octavius]